MPSEIIPNYEVIEKLGESIQSIIYKAINKKHPDQPPVILKLLKTGYMPEHQKLHFRQKIEQLKVLSDPMLIRPLAFETKDEIQFIIREYFDGIPLDKWIYAQSGKVSLENFFTVSLQLSQAINKIHEAGIIHGGIKPHNILIHPKSLSVKIIDFISSLDTREISHFIYEQSFVENTLAYTSPEQTGRISHRVDFSSDLYSLGIVFYKMLTGLLPFFSLDPLELIHSHLAEEAVEAHILNAEIPVALSKIITKLILKQPEKRYQSVTGLLADLTQCRNEYLTSGSIQEFPLGRYDYTQRIVFISKMVGRANETKLILNEYDKTSNGNFSSLFICGLPGIGKTRLIQELQKPIIEHQGYFTSGKFDLYQKNIPYSALIQALRNLIRTFLTESDERVQNWKKKILEAVEDKGKVVTDVIPELEILIGIQKEIPQLPPVESRNRFNYVFDRFLTALATKENPLTLFIDDLQWCDNATFDFLENIFNNYKNHKYLFFIGAWRHNEVNTAHPLSKLIHYIKEQRLPIQEAKLEALEPQYCHEMVSYILDSALADTSELSKFITELSEGNPLFVSEILSYLHYENLLFLDNNHQWKWDINKIRNSDMPPNVVALFSSKVKKLPAQTIELLQYCACMGNRFSPMDISLIKEIPLLNAFETLKSALSQGLLMENKDDLQFVHDRVQEAVLKEIPSENKRLIHWDIGNHLFRQAIKENNHQEIETLVNLFAIAAHMNLGKPEQLDKKTAYLLSDINYHAGNKALSALATDAANEYFKIAREILPEDCWENQYEKTFKIYQKCAKTELMCGNYNTSEQLLNTLLESAKTDLDKTESLAEQTTSLSSIGNFIKAIETANRGLNFFNKSLPENEEEAEKKREELMNEIETRNKDIWNTIINMPFTQERRSKIELAFYSELIPDLYMSGMVPQLYLSAVQSTQHCLSGGMDESVIYSFAIMGLYLGEKGEFDKAFKYEDLARNLCEKYPNTFGATRGMNGIVWCNAHSRSTPEEIIAYCSKAIQCGKNSGDLYNAGLSYGPLMWNMQILGQDFRKLEEFAHECLDFSSKYHLYFSVRLAQAMQAGWIEPMKKDYKPMQIDEKIEAWEKDNHIAAIGSYYVHMGIMHYYFKENEEAESHLQRVKRYLKGLTDNVLKRLWHVFLVLNALRLHETGILYKTKEELNTYIEPLIEKIKTWAKLGPLLQPYVAFVYAEIEKVKGNKRNARNLYLDAIDIAQQNNYTFLEGFFNESLCELYNTLPEYKLSFNGNNSPSNIWNISSKESSGIKKETSKDTAKLFIKEALRLYKKCHAERKMICLIERYPEYLEEEIPVEIQKTTNQPSILPNIDINYLMKSSLILPVETEEKILLHKIMNVVLESSGAQHGYLIIEEKQNLIIRAESHITQKDLVKTINQKIEDCPDLCHAIVRFVHRTKEIVLLENASEKGTFKDNLQVQALKLKSILCLPLIKQNKLIGILYLENKLASSVFTPERTEMTKLFTFEAAIAIENAKLLEQMKEAQSLLKRHREHLEEMVEKRTIQLNKAQQNLLIAERLAVLGQLAGNISHEIRNPLNVISTSAYFLKMKVAKSDKKLQEHIAHIENEVKNTTSIIESLLSLSGMKEPRKEKINLIETFLNTIKSFTIPKSIKLKMNIPKKSLFITADKEQLFITFQNILKNSLQAMENKGTLTITIKEEDENKALLSFKDTGLGISEENMEKVFQPLFSTKPKGLGFGLLICKMIVEKHGGVISIDSKLGKGTTITISLNLVKD